MGAGVVKSSAVFLSKPVLVDGEALTNFPQRQSPNRLPQNRQTMKVTILITFLAIVTSLNAQFEFAGGPYGALAVDMCISDSAIYVATLHGLYRSVNEGQSWDMILDVPVHSTILSDVSAGVEVKWEVEAKANHVLFIYHEDVPDSSSDDFFFLWSDDYGNSWQARNFPVFQNEVKKFGRWKITDSLVFMQTGKLLFYSANKGVSWDLMELPAQTKGVGFDGENPYFWDMDTLRGFVDFPLGYYEYPIDFPHFDGNTLLIKNGLKFARSFDPITGNKDFWASPCLECQWEIKPELAGINEFDIVVKNDSIYLWPGFNWEANRLWIADTSVSFFTREEYRKTPTDYFSLFNTHILEAKERFYIFASYTISFRPYDDRYDAASFWSSNNKGYAWNNIEDGIYEPLINCQLLEDDKIWVGTSYGLFESNLDNSDWTLKGDSDWAASSIARFEGRLWRISIEDNHPRVFWSDDEGFTWTPDVYAGTGKFIATPEALFLNIGNGFVIRKMPAQDQWDDISANLPDNLTRGILDVWYQGKVFLYDGNGVLYSSDDLGASWQFFPFPTNIYTPFRMLTTIGNELYFVLGRENPAGLKVEIEFYRWDESFQLWQLVSDKLKLDYYWQTQKYYRKISGFVKSEGNWYLGVRGHGIYHSDDNAENWSLVTEDEVSRNTYSLDVSNNWLYNTSQFFGTWKMWLGNSSSSGTPSFSEIKIFPNPSSGIAYIEGCESCSVEIYDVLGRLVSKQMAIGGLVDLSSMENGKYVLKVYGASGIKIKKIMKCR